MSTLETMHGLLHDDKHRTMRQRLEVFSIVFVLSGAWVGVGYAWRDKAADERLERAQTEYAGKLEAMRERQARDIDALREKHGRALDSLRLTCAKKEIEK